jgi:hypothetical protein
MLTVDDRRFSDNQGEDSWHKAPVEVYDAADGSLACAGEILDNTELQDFDCLLSRNKNYYVFIQPRDDHDADTNEWYLIYVGKVFGPTFLRTESRGDTVWVDNRNALIEVLVIDDLGNPLENRNVKIKAEDGQIFCDAWTMSDGKVLCPVNDYFTPAADDYKPNYDIIVSGGSSTTKQIFYEATTQPLSNFPTYDMSFDARDPTKLLVPMGKESDAGSPVVIGPVTLNAGEGSNLEKGNLTVIVLDTERNDIGSGTDVRLYRAGTNTGYQTAVTDVDGKAYFNNLDPYFAYDIRTDYGEKRNVYIQPGGVMEITLRQTSEGK